MEAIKEKTEEVVEPFSPEWLEWHMKRLSYKGMIKWLGKSQRKDRKRFRNSKTVWKDSDLPGFSNKWKCGRNVEQRRDRLTRLHVEYNKLRGRPYHMHIRSE